jgi:uncharacterized protein involved in exopolysaccharide biosynthesis
MSKTDPSDFTIFARWFSVAFIVFVLTAWVGFYTTKQFIPNVYRATADIEVWPTNYNKTTPQTDRSLNPAFDPSSLQADLEVIRSTDVLQPVISDLNLDQIWAKRFHQGNGGKLTPADALAHLKETLKIDLIRGTNIVTITTTSEMPYEAAHIANAIADRYKMMRDTQKTTIETPGKNSLRDFIEQQQQVVDKKKEAVDKLLADQPNPQSDPYHQAQEDYEKEKKVLDALNNHLKQMEADDRILESPVRIIMRAKIPTAPISQNEIIYRTIWIMAGLFLGMLAATLTEVGFFVLQQRQAS